ncbi:MAG: hypothetical protein HUU50_05015 [Candidatus Brocadiae bacterium]|nr:hypothetical protein [Candidatus Brocadiia bacterium]
MKELLHFSFLQKKILKNNLHTLRQHSWLKILVVSFFALVFFVTIFVLFYRGLRFVESYIPHDFFTMMVEYLFSVFYFALFLMLTFSSSIIAFSVFFHANETQYLFTSPISFPGIFFYKFFETFAFASWSVFFLGIPICFAYGIHQNVSWEFYPGLILLFIPFICLPAILGTLAAFIVILYFIRFRKIIAIGFFALLVFGILLLIVSISSLKKEVPSFTTAWFLNVVDYLNFIRHPLFPSLWTSKGMLSLAQQDYRDFFFQLTLLVSQCLLLGSIAYILSFFKYDEAYSKAHSFKTKKNIWRWNFFSKIFSCLPFLQRHDRIFLEKDIKIFLRDPLQWGQFAILLGLLLLYVLNLRTLRYDEKTLFWKHLIASLNLTATALINCTFASRFIFPMLSLEGKRFWMLGVMPLKRSGILIAKFFFAVVTLFITSEVLIVLSCYMLKMPWDLTFFHAFTVFCLTLGVASLSVGMGAIYPNFKEDSPSKIVSGFGGTLNLILNLFFVLAIVSLQNIPSYWLLKGAGNDYKIYLGLGLTTLVTCIACALPLYIGEKSFSRLEM